MESKILDTAVRTLLWAFVRMGTAQHTIHAFVTHTHAPTPYNHKRKRYTITLCKIFEMRHGSMVSRPRPWNRRLWTLRLEPSFGHLCVWASSWQRLRPEHKEIALITPRMRSCGFWITARMRACGLFRMSWRWLCSCAIFCKYSADVCVFHNGSWRDETLKDPRGLRFRVATLSISPEELLPSTVNRAGKSGEFEVPLHICAARDVVPSLTTSSIR